MVGHLSFVACLMTSAEACGGVGGGRGITAAMTAGSADVPIQASAAATASWLEVSRRRRATKNFAPVPVPPGALERALAEAQLAPSAFNVQPWRAVVVRGDDAKAQLAHAMLGPNKKRVRDAGATVVFAADCESMRERKRFLGLLRRDGHQRELSLWRTALYVSVFSNGHRWGWLRGLLLLGKRLAFAFASRIGFGMPFPSSAEAWAFKNTMMAVEQFMLAAAAEGLSTLPMEGFDMRRLRRALGIPRRFLVPVVVAVGYPAASASGRIYPPSTRFPPEEQFYDDSWGNRIVGIPVAYRP